MLMLMYRTAEKVGSTCFFPGENLDARGKKLIRLEYLGKTNWDGGREEGRSHATGRAFLSTTKVPRYHFRRLTI